MPSWKYSLGPDFPYDMHSKGASVPLDEFPPNHAWGLVHIVSAYQGPVIRVQRTTPDTTQQDFLPEEITDGTLASFFGSGDALIATQYDIAGGGAHEVQTDPAKMPKIGVAGSLITRGGLPAISYDGTDDGLLANLTLSVGTHCSLFSVLTTSDTGGVQYWANVNNKWSWVIQQNSDLTNLSDRFTILSISKNGVAQTLNDRGDWWNAFGDGVKHLSYLRGTIVDEEWSVFGLHGYTGFALGGLSQLVTLYTTDQQANQAGIEAAINSIYP